MGFKRPFDDEQFPELPFKQYRQLGNGDKMDLFGNNLPYDEKHDISGEGESSVRKFPRHDANPDHIVANVSIFDKDFDISAPLSLLTSSYGEEDVGSGATPYLTLSEDYFEFNFPHRTLVPFEDTHSSLLDRSPQKQVPIGPDHQAAVPLWSEQINKKLYQIDMLKEQLMGTCVLPMPNSKVTVHDGGRMDCVCLDRRSVRCVQQHIMEARERLIKSLGHEKFANLGFYEMGEEVASRWSEEEEQAFHEVVFSNPASMGKNFWKHLSVAFPSRTKKEIVSYYFNVFMLRRRAAQNRSNLLDIDSDDDEWHESIIGPLKVLVREEDEDSAIESLDDQAYNEENSSENDDDDDGDNDNENGDGDGNVGDGRKVILQQDDSGIDPDKIPGSFGEDFDVQDDSCLSFECQPNMADSRGPVIAEPAAQMNGIMNGIKINHSECKMDGPNGGMVHMYFSEPCDSKLWDIRYPTDPIKAVDLLPTNNMIEEIFGIGNLDNKTEDS